MAIQDGTITGNIQYGQSKELRHANFHFKVMETDAAGNERIYNYDNIFDKYRDVLMAHTRVYAFSDSEIEKYRYKPRSFCVDTYVNGDLWSLLLRINNMLTSTDFTKKTIRIMNNKFIEVLKEILVIEDDRMEEEKNKYNLR